MISLTSTRWGRTISHARWPWPALIIALALAAGALTWWDVQSPLRTAITLVFLVICPGMAFVRLLRIRDPLAELTLGIALSIALDALVAGALLYGKFWFPVWGMLALVVLSIAGAVLQLIRIRNVVISREEAL